MGPIMYWADVTWGCDGLCVVCRYSCTFITLQRFTFLDLRPLVKPDTHFFKCKMVPLFENIKNVEPFTA